MSQVFLSHVQEDAKIALEIALALEEAGYSTWFYEVDCVPGHSYLIQTGEAIEEAKVILLIISPSSIGSHQVTKEVVRTHESGKHFIPIRWNITHEEFQKKQPEWREALGSATSIEIPSKGVQAVQDRIIDGMAALKIKPKSKPNKERVDAIKTELIELKTGVKKKKKSKEGRYDSDVSSARVDDWMKRRTRNKIIKWIVGIILLIILIVVVITFFSVPTALDDPIGTLEDMFDGFLGWLGL